MDYKMQHSPGDNLFSFIVGVIMWGISTVAVQMLNVNVYQWIPPLIPVISAFAGGFLSMWGKDTYRKWRAKKDSKTHKKITKHE